MTGYSDEKNTKMPQNSMMCFMNRGSWILFSAFTIFYVRFGKEKLSNKLLSRLLGVTFVERWSETYLNASIISADVLTWLRFKNRIWTGGHSCSTAKHQNMEDVTAHISVVKHHIERGVQSNSVRFHQYRYRVASKHTRGVRPPVKVTSFPGIFYRAHLGN